MVFLEAITIQESIITDRLIGYLSRPTASNPISKNKYGQWPSLHKLIQCWRSEVSNASQADSCKDLIDATEEWRITRNMAVHAIVRSDPGQPTQSIDDFLEKAREAAEQGEYLAKEVTNWCRKEKKKTASNL
ncbi:hypothetical protein K9N68_02045 [Kovacikia minuta CCNUW1]|uniref:hypothetical protein n=1 Tax=Kovacikia minuta TaxID=2931930 RepID=UPI001CCC014A|nr:hypothetical protein [Kovacikia minuta]UBF26799.1 hypothetical protein K9N68_02045 [Kovacikia minuta CCNUW1]